jgi:VWFA-related protein
MQRRFIPTLRILCPFAFAALAWAAVEGQTRILFPARPISVEFRALGPDGSPVLDLERSDVVLKVGGKQREIASLDLVRFDGTGAGLPGAAALPVPFVTNDTPAEQRDILLVLDDNAMAPGTEKPVRSVVDQLLQNLAPRDRVSVINIPTGRSNVALTTDRAAIRASLAELIGLSTRGQSVADFQCQTLLTLESLKNLILAVRGGPSTTMVFFSAGLTLPETVAPLRLGQPTETCIVRTNHYNDFQSAATLAGVNFYAVHVYDDSAMAQGISTNDLVAGLELVTGAANGDLIRLTADVGDRVARAVRETTGFYRVTFEPEPAERDDQVHRLEVSVARPGVTVRAKQGLAIDKASGAKPQGKKRSVQELLRVGESSRDLSLRAAAFPSRGETKDTVKLVVVFETGDVEPAIASAAIALYDERGRLTSQVTLRKEELSSTPPFTALSVKPGFYRLRVAVEDRSGRMGTLDTQVHAQLAEAAPITMSGMVLGTRSRGRFAPQLLFSDEPALVTYLEVYGVPKAVELSGAVELASAVDGPALGAVAATVLPGNDEGTWQVQAGIALSQIPAGDYVLRTLIVVDGKLVGKASRTLRKR